MDVAQCALFQLLAHTFGEAFFERQFVGIIKTEKVQTFDPAIPLTGSSKGILAYMHKVNT